MDGYLKVTRIWRSLAESEDTEALLDYVGPLIVRSDAEQQRFAEKREVYARILTRLTQREPERDTAATARPETPEEDARPPGRMRYFIASLLIGLTLSLLVIGLWKPPPPTGEIKASTDVSAVSKVGCRNPKAFNYDPEAEVDCEGCCDTIRIGCRNPEALNFDSLATQACDSCCAFAARPNLASLVARDSLSWIAAAPAYAYTLPRLTPVESGPWQWLARYKTRLSYLIPILCGFLFVGWYLWRRARRDYIARRHRSERPPFRLPIRVRRDKRLQLDERFGYVLDRLRGREAGERSLLVEHLTRHERQSQELTVRV